MAFIPEETIDRLYGEVSVDLLDHDGRITLDALLEAFQTKLSRETNSEDVGALKLILVSLQELKDSENGALNLNEMSVKKGVG